MAFKETFCNSPWYELHIFWDGAYGYCCQQRDPPYSPDKRDLYNVSKMSVADWYNSQPMRQARLQFFKQEKNKKCATCWKQEESNTTSRRHRSNQKSVIFQKQNFKDSYQQSPGFKKFEYSKHNDGFYNGLPIDLHIDLGNHCNLACKMCRPDASSKIAAQFNKWGMLDNKKFLGSNWTADDKVWNRFLNELIEIPNLKNIHFMGGETLLTKRFHDFVNFFIERGRFDVCFSFVSNGTVYDKELFVKLEKFKRVGIEVSAESYTPHNEYVRQGTVNSIVFDNICKIQHNHTNNKNITLSIRPAVGALSIGYYYTLIDFAIQNKFIIKSSPVLFPPYLQTSVLPKYLRNQYVQNYLDLEKKYNSTQDTINAAKDFNESDHNNYLLVAYQEIKKSLHDLSIPDHLDQPDLLKQMFAECKRWDQVYGVDINDFYPEFVELAKTHGY